MSQIPNTTVELSLPWPPSVNNYWRHNRGRTHISHVGQAYRLNVAAAVLSRGVPMRLACALEVRVVLYPPDRLERDIDNVLKALLDSLAHSGVYENDSQIRKLTIEFEEVRRGGVVSVTIRETEDKHGEIAGRAERKRKREAKRSLKRN